MKKRRRRCRRSNSGPWGPWNLLPDGVLLCIIMKLSIVNFFALGRVCRLRRSAALDNKKCYMENLKPLVLFKSRFSRGSCYLLDIFNGEEYKAVLPDLRGKQIVGLSCEYLITLGKSFEFWLVNLMTKDELRFPVFPKQMMHIVNIGFRARLFKSTTFSQVCMILFSMMSNCLLLCVSGGKSWEILPLLNGHEALSDVKDFGKRIYVLTLDAQIGIFDLSRRTVLKLHKTDFTFKLSSCTNLVILNKKLCIRAYIWSSITNHKTNMLYELDCETMKWRKKDEMGRYSLFLDQSNSAIVDASEWGGVNIICTLEDRLHNTWSLRRLDDINSLAEVPVIWNDDHKLFPLCWYFPNESCSIPVVM